MVQSYRYVMYPTTYVTNIVIRLSVLDMLSVLSYRYMYVGRIDLRNTVIGLSVHGHVRTVLFAICMCDVCSNIVIGLSITDHMSSTVQLFRYMYVGRMF